MSKMPWSSMAQKRAGAAPARSGRQGSGDGASVSKNPSSPIREFLLNLGLANLVLGLETRFRKVAYFSTSAIEELPSASRLAVPPRAAVPLLWLIQQSGTLPAAAPPLSAGNMPVTAKIQQTQREPSPSSEKGRETDRRARNPVP